MRQTVLAFVLFLLAQGLYSQQNDHFLKAPPEPSKSALQSLTASTTRSVVAMNGPWEYSLDDGDTWHRVVIPACYLDFDRYLLRRSFTIPKGLIANHRWKLVAYGMQYSGSVSINGTFIVQREGLIPFDVSIPEDIQLKESNTIEVEVDNRLDYSRTLPGRRIPLDVRTYGGIVRDIFLVGTPRVWIDEVRVKQGKTPEFEVNVVSGTIRGMSVAGTGDSGVRSSVINTDQANFTVSVSVASAKPDDSTGTGSSVASAEQVISLQNKRTSVVLLKPELSNLSPWGPGTPQQYSAKVQVKYQGVLIDEQIVSFGSRQLQARGNRLYLNDSILNVRGVIYIEDSKDYGASLSYQQMADDIREIRDMGVNLIRFCGGVPHPYLLELCEKEGILAFIDIPIGSSPSHFYTREKFVERALDRTRAAVEATRSYGCVVGYGVGFPAGIDGARAVQLCSSIRQSIDSMHNGALFYAVSNDWSDPELLNQVDIAGIGLLDGNVDQVGRLIEDVTADVAGKKPVLLLAFGRLVKLGNQNGYSDSMSTQSQAKYIGDVLNRVEQSDLAGLVYWAYNDYRTDRPLLTVNNDDQYIASCGLTTLDRQMRIAGKMLAALYTDQKVPDLAIGEYAAPSTVLFIAIGIGCAILFLLLINNSRRFRENVFRSLLRPFNFYADIRDQRILSTVQTTVLALVVSMTVAVIFASLFYFYRMDESFDVVMSAVLTSDSAKQFVDYLIWRPGLAIVAFTGMFFGLLLLVALLIRICSFFVRNKIFFSDAYTIAVWGALPGLLLIPLAMILYRLLELPAAGAIAFTIVFGVVGWMLYRVLRGTAVVYDVRSSRVYLYTLGSIAVVFLILFFTSSNIAAMFNYVGEGIAHLYSRG